MQALDSQMLPTIKMRLLSVCTTSAFLLGAIVLLSHDPGTLVEAQGPINILHNNFNSSMTADAVKICTAALSRFALTLYSPLPTLQ